ncbi:MAG: hypothetical protein GX557_12935 [Chloroflexi bacterium]|nr:hypothetical protein [Chloroflexota bacterium]
MRNPRCWREVLIRGGIMTIVAAASYFVLHADAWIWLLPVVISLLVIVRWALRPSDEP